MNKIKQLLKKWFGWYTEKDLISFGLYLLSEERSQNIDKSPILYSGNVEEKKRRVYDSDLANWKANG